MVNINKRRYTEYIAAIVLSIYDIVYVLLVSMSLQWPSPTNYTLKQVLGPIHVTSHTMPSHSIIQRRVDKKVG